MSRFVSTFTGVVVGSDAETIDIASGGMIDGDGWRQFVTGQRWYVIECGRSTLRVPYSPDGPRMELGDIVEITVEARR